MINITSLLITFASFFGIYTILSISLNLEYGYGGQPNFGKVAFFAMGAFVAGIVASRILPLIAGMPVTDPLGPRGVEMRIAISSTRPIETVVAFTLTLILATVVGAFFGYIFSYPALRIREEWFLAMVLLVSGEIVRIIVRSYPPMVGGYQGLAGVSNPFRWVNDATKASTIYAGLILTIALAVYFLAERLVNSPFGRLLKSVRDDPAASMSLGKDIQLVRAQVLIIGSALAALAGALYAHYIGFVTPDDFVPIRTFDVWVMVVLGGMANNKGAVAGAAVMTTIDRATAMLAVELGTSSTFIEFNYVRYVLVGILMIVMLMFRQKGLLPEKPVKTPAYEVMKD